MLRVPPVAGTDDDIAMEYQVQSVVLCTASVVFRAMLGRESKFREAVSLRAAKGSLYTLELGSEDDPVALECILAYLHHKNTIVPTEVSFETLVQLAILTDKYVFTDALSFVKHTWMQKWKSRVLDDGFEAWALVAHVFGDGNLYKQITKKWITHGTVEYLDGPLNFEAGVDLPEHAISKH